MSGFKHLKGRCNLQEHKWLQEGPGKMKASQTCVNLEPGHCYLKIFMSYWHNHGIFVWLLHLWGLSLTRWKDFLRMNAGPSVAHIKGAFAVSAWWPWPPPPPTPGHYFLMSNHHLTAALSMHTRQLIAHGKSAATSKTIRHLKYFGRNADLASVFSASAVVRPVQLQDIHH